MKYVNLAAEQLRTHRTTRFGALLAVAVVVVLSACSGTSVKEDATANAVVLEILPTDGFLPIPVEGLDKEGKPLPYVPAVNPYVAQKGRIKKEHVSAYIEARRAFKAGQYEQAEKMLNKLTKEASELSGPWVMLGDISLEAEQYEIAGQRFTKALEINPENVNSYLRLAHALRVQGKFIESQNTYAEALSVWRDFPEAHLNLAVLYDVYMNEPLKAQQHMEAYQFLSGKKNEQVNQWLAEIRSRTGVPYSIKAGAPKSAGETDASVSLAGG